MKAGKRFLALALTAVIMALSGCSLPFGSELDQNANRTTDVSQPPLAPQAQNQSQIEVPLFFQYGNEAYLSSENRTLTVSDSDSLEKAIVESLIAGPSAANPQLRQVINTNTRLVSLDVKEGCYYLTLTGEFLEPISGLPEHWREDPTWVNLVATSQQLAAYSVVDSLLILGRCQQVQILISAADGSAARRPTRGELGFGDGTNDSQIMPPFTLDLSKTMTSTQAAQLVLRAFSDKNWARVERFIAQSVPDRSTTRPEKEALIDQLTQADVTLVDFSIEETFIAVGGQNALVNAALTLQRKGSSERQQLTGLPLALVWENSGWALSYSSLLLILGDTP